MCFPLVEGQTLLHGGRFRFLRRIGSGTFAVILRALDVRDGRTVAIKCMQRQEFNAIGEQEAAILRQISATDSDGHCPDTFIEQELFCLVLEILGDAVLNVSLWGPWRQPYQERSLHSPSSSRRHKLHSVVGTTRAPTPISIALSSPPSAVAAVGRAASPMPVCCPFVSPLSLDDVRQIAVHLCGALAFLHGQGLIHADLKPENIVRSSPVSSSPSTAPVKLIDFGNCIENHKIALYQARESKKTTHSDAGFDVQTLAYRGPEVAAGIEISSAIDMWSLGCVLLECASGEPLFTTSPAVFGVDAITGHETENEVILRQIELLVNNGKPLSAVHEAYQAAECYSGTAKVLNRSSNSREQVTGFPTLRERLEAMAPVSESTSHAHFHDFIKKLLTADPNTRLTARGALLHPFVQAFFPFKLVFLNAEPVRPAKVVGESPAVTTTSEQVKKTYRASSQSIKQKKREPEQLQEGESLELATKKKKRQRFALLPSAAAVNSAQASSLRAALKLIPTMKREV
ncbi:Cmgc protein kinase [Globisporangium polare]